MSDFSFEDEGRVPRDTTAMARKRMLRDIVEWNRYSHECPMITAAPLQENLFEWHINMNPTSGVLRNTIIHLIVTFPPNYPKQPPTVRVCSHFPHPNVFHESYWKYNRYNKWVWTQRKDQYICLDMLNRKGVKRHWVGYADVPDQDRYEADMDRQVIEDSYHGWSPAYSVTSVLLQLSSFLYEEKSAWRQQRGLKGMREASEAFACQKCGHSYKVPYPPLSCHKVSKQSKRRKKKQQYKLNQKEGALEYFYKQQPEGQKEQISEEHNDKLQIQMMDNRISDVEQTRKSKKQRIQQSEKNGTVKKCTTNLWQFLYDDVERMVVRYLTLRDLMKFATVSTYHQKMIDDTKLLQIHRFGCWFHRVDLSFHNELIKIRGKVHGWNEKAMLKLQSKENENREVYNLTLGYGIIPTFYPSETSFQSHIHSDDLAAMKRAEEALESMDEYKSEGQTSKSSLSKLKSKKIKCGKNALDFPLLQEVKATFDLLSADAYLNHNIHTTPWNDQSFHNFLPIYINEQHGKRSLECIEEFVLQCYSKHDPKVTTFHPLMAVHLIANIMNTLVVHLMQKFDENSKQQGFAYAVVTDAHSTALRGANRWDRWLMDHKNEQKQKNPLNLHYSINVLESYFHFHHLLLGIYQKYYSILQPVVENKCKNFINDSQYRMKKYVPNLGEMMVWLTLNRITWDDACPALLDECFVRHIKWVLLDCPELYKVSNETSCIRLRKTFEHSTTSVRLYMFQYFFLKHCCEIGTVSPMDKLDEYNQNFGCPPAHLPYELQKWCRKIYKVNDWMGFFDMIDIPCPSAKSLCKWLEYALIESDRRGYHKNVDVDLLAELKKMHYQNAEKIFTPNMVNEQYCLCSEEVIKLPKIALPETNKEGYKSKKVIFADIVIKKFMGGRRRHPKVPGAFYFLCPEPKKPSVIKAEVDKLLKSLQFDQNASLNVRYKLECSSGGRTKWVWNFDDVFVDDPDENAKKYQLPEPKNGVYLWKNDADYYRFRGYQTGYIKREHRACGGYGDYEWRTAAQKYIIDLDIINNDDTKPVVIPITLLNETSGDGQSDFCLNQKVKCDDIIYYVTLPQVLNFHKLEWNDWYHCKYALNLDGFVDELHGIYAHFKQRKSMPIIAELFENFKQRNPNLAANSHSTDIFKFFSEDCRRGRAKNKIISKHFVGSMVWFQPKYEDFWCPTRGLTESKSDYAQRVYEWGICEETMRLRRLNTKYEDAWYCGEVLRFYVDYPDPQRKYISNHFYQIKAVHPQNIPIENVDKEWIATNEDMNKYKKIHNIPKKQNLQKHVAISQYSGIANSDSLICTIMFQRAYSLNIGQILPFHAKHCEIEPIQHCRVQLKNIKQSGKNTLQMSDCELMNIWLNDRRRHRINGFGQPEIIQIAINRKELSSRLYDRKYFEKCLKFMKERDDAQSWDDCGCIYRSRQYSEFYANARGAVKLCEQLPIFDVPQFDPYEECQSFMHNEYEDPTNIWPTFDPVQIQAFDVETHRWFNAKIIRFASMSVIIHYDDWDKRAFQDKISISSHYLAPADTHPIKDNKIGYLAISDSISSNKKKQFFEEYEAKQTKQRRFDEKFKLLNDEYYFKYFFEAVADNNLKIVRQLLSFGRNNCSDEEAMEQNIKNDKIKNKANNGSKWTAFDWNDSDKESEENNFQNVKISQMNEMDWLKWMNRCIDVNMTDAHGRTPLFCVAYNGYFQMFELLCKYGLDLNVIDIYGQNALDAANKGLQNGLLAVTKKKQINDIIGYLRENMTDFGEGKESKSWRRSTPKTIEKKDESAVTTKSRWNIGNDEVIWTSSMIYVGNLPFDMSESDICSFFQKYHIKPTQVIKRNNYSLIRVRSDLSKLLTKIDKINGVFFRGAMITVNLFERGGAKNKNKNVSKARSLNMGSEQSNDFVPGSNDNLQQEMSKKEKEIVPNTALFVNNFDVTPGIYTVLENIFCAFGKLSDNVQIGVDKFGDPFAKIQFWELKDAICCYETAHSLDKFKVGLRTLKVEYSKFVQTPQRYQRNGFHRPQKNGFNRSKYQNGTIRPQSNGFIRPKAKTSTINGMIRPKAISSKKNGTIRPKSSSHVYNNGHYGMNGSIRPKAVKVLNQSGRAKKNESVKPKRKRNKKQKLQKVVEKKEDVKLVNDGGSDGWAVKGRKKKNRRRNR